MESIQKMICGTHHKYFVQRDKSENGQCKKLENFQSSNKWTIKHFIINCSLSDRDDKITENLITQLAGYRL